MTPSRFTLEVWPVTDPGQTDENEDFVLVHHPTDEAVQRFSGSLYIVADGLGGGGRGQMASRYAAQKVMHAYYNSDEPDIGYRLRQAVEAANADLYDYVKQRPELVKMGTTIVAVAVRGEQLSVAAVGDSRAYVVREGTILQVTRDHTLVQQLLEEEAITPDEAAEHPRRDLVLRTLGGAQEVEVDVYDFRLHPDDVLVMCTDGLTGVVHDDEIAHIVATSSPRSAAETLVQKANDRAGKDNITVLAALARAGGPPLVGEVPYSWDGTLPSFSEQPTLAVPRVERPAPPPEPPAEADATVRTAPVTPPPPGQSPPVEPVPAPPYQASVQPAPAFGQPAAPPPGDRPEPPTQVPPTATQPVARPVQPQGSMPIDPVTGLPPVPPPQAQQPAAGGIQPGQPGIPVGYQPRVYQPPTPPNIGPPRRGVSLGAFVAVGVLAVLLTVLMVLILVNPWGWQLPFIGGGLAAATTPAAEQTAETQATPEPTVVVVEPTTAVDTAPLPTPTPEVVAPPNMVLIPGGAFQRGATDAEIDDAVLSCIQERADGQCFREWFTDAQPVEDITLSPFFIDVTEVTNLAYAECVASGVCSAPDNTEFYDDPAFSQHPVVYVDYDQAMQYCGWAGKRLPTEAEWEKAARYDPATGDEYRYPWGNSFEVGIANTSSAGQGGLTAVQAFPGDLSPSGVLGMAGNASEWVQDWYFGNYEGLGTLNPVRLGAQPLPEPFRTARGGNFATIAAFARAAHRLDVPTTTTEAWLGFRCAQSAGGETPSEPTESPVEPAATEESTELPAEQPTETPLP